MDDNDKNRVLATFEHSLNENEGIVTLYNSETGEKVCSFIAKPMSELSEEVIHDNLA